MSEERFPVGNPRTELEGKHLVTRDANETLTGLKTFDRGTNPPFAIANADAGLVDNLDAEKLGGQTLAQVRDASQLTGALPNESVPNPLPGVSGENLTSLIASRLTNWVVQTKIVDYTLLVTDDLVRFQAATKTLSLPGSASVGYKEFTVSNEAASGVITVDPNGSDMIFDGIAAKTATYLGPGEMMRFRSHGDGWVVTGRNGFVTRCDVYRATSNQAIVTSTETKVQFNGEIYDRFAEWDNATNYHWTAIEAMEVLVHGHLYFVDGVTDPYGYFGLNGANALNLSRFAASGQALGPVLTWQGRVAAGDTLQMMVQHSTGADRNVYAVGAFSRMTIRRTL